MTHIRAATEEDRFGLFKLAVDKDSTQQFKAITQPASQSEIARKLLQENVFDTVQAIRAGDAPGARAAFNKSGDYEMTEDPVITPEVRDIGGNKVTTYNATFPMLNKKTGVVTQVSKNSHDMSVAIMPAEKALDYQLKASKEASEATERAAKGRYWNANADALAPGGTKDKSGNAIDRMSEVDKITFVNIGKQRNLIQSAIAKSQADGSYDPNSVGARELSTQLAALTLKESQIQKLYADDGSTAPDPAGLRKPSTSPASPASATKVTPTEQKARDSDAATILQTELKSAQTRLAAGDTRAQADIDGLTREIGRLSKGSTPVPPPAPKKPPTQPVNAPALAAQGVQARVPTYENWIAAKSAKDDLLSAASKMSSDRREAYLSSRLPQIEQAIRFHQNYRTY